MHNPIALQIKNLIDDFHEIVNWSPLKRCIMMLILAIGANILWLFWKGFVLFSPELHKYINYNLIKILMVCNTCFILILMSLIYPCYKLKNQDKAQFYLPYICVATFVLTLIFDGYMIGIMSPATLCSMMSIIAVGLILFSTRLVYSMVIISVLLFCALMYGCLIQAIPYAPLFNLEVIGEEPYFNLFWLSSMLFFILPIVVTCYSILDLILRQWRARENRYQNLSQIDALTQLSNRRSINEYLSQIDEKVAPNCPFCIILLDIDHFKAINDRYGHLKGDEVLIEVAQILKKNTRSQDMVGRYGGEEFIILIQTDQEDLAFKIAERCRVAIMGLEFYVENQHVPITASFGISVWQAQNGKVQDAVHQADLAMYQAKQAGRNLIRSVS